MLIPSKVIWSSSRPTRGFERWMPTLGTCVGVPTSAVCSISSSLTRSCTAGPTSAWSDLTPPPAASCGTCPPLDTLVNAYTRLATSWCSRALKAESPAHQLWDLTGCEDVYATIRLGRSDQGSLPCSMPLQSRAGTSPGSPHTRRPPRRPGVGSSNRR